MELIVILVTIAACFCFALGYRDKQTMAYLQADLYAFPVIDNDPTIIPESIITPKQEEALMKKFTIGQTLQYDLLVEYTGEVVGESGEVYDKAMDQRYWELSLEAERLQGFTICTQCHQSELYCSCNLCPGCAKEWEACDCMDFWLKNNS